jgi:hypothetical protein
LDHSCKFVTYDILFRVELGVNELTSRNECLGVN